MRTIVKRLIPVILVANCSCQTFGPRVNVLESAGQSDALTVLDFKSIDSIDKLPTGWFHYKFWFVEPSKYLRQLGQETSNAIQCLSEDSASMLLRHARVGLSEYPELTWRWKVETNISDNRKDKKQNVDDSPARFFILLADAQDRELMFELYWDHAAPRGTEKRIKNFYHYAVRGNRDEINKWYDEKIKLADIAKKVDSSFVPLYVKIIGVFCDSDDGHSRSAAVFDRVEMQR